MITMSKLPILLKHFTWWYMCMLLQTTLSLALRIAKNRPNNTISYDDEEKEQEKKSFKEMNKGKSLLELHRLQREKSRLLDKIIIREAGNL